MRTELAAQGLPVTGRRARTRRGPLRPGVVLQLAGLVAAVGCISALTLSGGNPGRAPTTTTTRPGLTSLPMAAQGPVSAALGRDSAAYRVRGLQAVNPVQRFRAGFSRRGVRVVSGPAQLGITLSAYGNGSALQPVRPALPSANANRVRYAHGDLTEWYANGPLGIEQGFDVAARPSAAAGPLTLSLALSGNLAAQLRDDSVVFRGPDAALRYGGLVATDAKGHVLRSWLQPVRGHVLIHVADRGATYPLRVDPLIQQGEKLTGTGAIGTGRFGYSVALSGDGNTALIGAYYFSSDAGAAWVFTRTGSTWTQQGGKLVGTGHTGAGEFGHIGEGEFGKSVALSADGNTALIGGPRDDDRKGAAWVFTRSGSTWAQQGEKLTGTGEAGEGEFGERVALSPDGGTALVGGSRDNGRTGAAWVFTRSGSTWTQQGEKLTGTGESGEGTFGSDLALSEHGDTALIGGAGDNNRQGAAWVFTRSGSTWAQQGEKLTGTGESETGEFGSSVALSADGDTALIGGFGDETGAGAAWVFTRSGSTWAQQGEKLTGGGESGEGRFGYSVALSGDGGMALIGGPGDDGGTGAAWVFTRSGSTWAQQGEKLTGGGETGEGRFGYGVALSADGETALIGGPEDDSATGAAWVLTHSGGTWSQQGSKLTGGEEGNSQFGVLVSLSADGNTALIGGWNDHGTKGAVWVFARTGGVWTQQGPKLTGAGEIGEGGFGTSVALSADGDTALIGGPGDNSRKGAAWVFTRSGSTWTQQGEKLTGGGEAGSAWFGYTVALSGDGRTALIGGWLDNNWKGAAWVFTRSGSTWTQQGEKLTGGGEIGEGMFGTNVALSADGNTALIGGWNDDTSKGAAWVFTRAAGMWTQQGPKLTGASEIGEGRFGVGVALSADGNTALIGGLYDNGTRGAAWMFTRSGSTWAQRGAKLTGGDEAGEGEFGTNVALSADGDTALIGGWRDNGGTGAGWVFVDPPAATTGAATDVGDAGATLNGTLAAGGSSRAHFQYGTTTAYGAATATQSVGVSSSPSPLAAGVGGLAPETTYHFRLVAENSGGVAYGSDQTFKTEARGEVITIPPPQPIPSPLPPGESSMRPVVQHARQSTARWREGSRLARISRAKPPIGTTFSFSLNEQATVTFSFAQRVGGKRTVSAGRLTFIGHTGTNRVAFEGRISPARKLKPGRYRLAITATNSAGVSSPPKSLSFTIVH